MQQFEDKNLDIFEELLEASGELNVTYFPKKLWGNSTRMIAEAGENLGYIVEPMPKFIDFEKCRLCGKCVNGCLFDAKWDGIVSAGALNTPAILKNSGIKNVGGQIFFDIFTTIGGYLKDANLKNELMMGVKAEFGPYFLSPHYSMQLLPLMKNQGIDAEETDVIGLMLKFADTCIGTIDSEGNIEKTLTKVDVDLIKEGYEKASWIFC